jgi:F-type H+-transporting ATPase subunit delta
MPSKASAKRYAQAVFEIALESDELDGWLDDLAALVREMGSREFADFVDAPQVSIERKTELVRGALGDTMGPMAVNLLLVLASRGIASVLPSVAEEYQQIVDSHRGVERAEVITAVQLDQKQLDEISSLLRGIAGKDVTITDGVEPEILGGLIARIGDRVIDGSTRTRLQQMRKSLA